MAASKSKYYNNLLRGFMFLNMYKIYFVELNEVIDESTFSKLSTLVSVERQQQVKKKKFYIDQKLTVYSETLVRALACSLYETKNNDLSFTRNAYGKPQLKGFSQFHFNISHTRSAIAVAIAEEEVGIDIELIKEADFNIARRFFTKQEQSYIFAKVADKEIEQQRRFYEIWTKKEAYIKYVGKGLFMPLKSFDVTQNSIQDKSYCIEKGGYIISICSKGIINNKNIRIMQLSESDLLRLVLSVVD